MPGPCNSSALNSFLRRVQPFVEEGQPILRLFPSSYWAVAVPVLAGVVLFGVTLLTLGAFLVVGELAK